MRKLILILILSIIQLVSYSQNKIFTFHSKLSTWGVKGIPDNVGSINAVSISYDEKQLAAAGDMGSLVIWDLETGKIKKILNDTNINNVFNARSVKYSNDNKYLAAVGSSVYLKTKLITKDNKTVVEKDGKAIERKVMRIYNATNYTIIKELIYDTVADILSCTFTPDCKYFVTGEYETPLDSVSVIRLYNTYDWEQVCAMKTYGTIWDLTFISTGNLLYVPTPRGYITQWKLNDGWIGVYSMMKLRDTEISSISLSPDDKWISINEDSHIKLYNISNPSIFREIKTVKYGNYAISFSNDNKYIAHGDGMNSCKIFDAKTHALIQTLHGDLNNPSQNEDKSKNNHTRTFFSSKTKYLVMANDAGFIYVYKKSK